MNEHSSVTQAQVPPSATLGGTPRTDAAYLEAFKKGDGSHSYALGWMLTFARVLELEIDELASALRELVACKDMKDRAWVKPVTYESANLAADYECRKPWAWRAARAALAKLDTTEGNARESASDAGERMTAKRIAQAFYLAQGFSEAPPWDEIGADFQRGFTHLAELFPAPDQGSVRNATDEHT